MGIQKNIKSLNSSQSQKTTIELDPYLNECASMVLDSSKKRWMEQLENAQNIFISNDKKNWWYQICGVVCFLSTTAFGAFLGQIIKLCNDNCDLVSHTTTIWTAIFFILFIMFKYWKDKLAPDYTIAKHEISAVLKDIKKNINRKEE